MHEQQPEQEPQSRPEPRIYVASLADYNAGRLHGTWLDATQGADELTEQIAAMLEQSTEPVAEDWAIHDHQGFGGINIGEHEPVDNIAWYGSGLAEHGTPFAGWISYHGGRPPDGNFDDDFLGSWSSRSDYAEYLMDDLGINEILDQHVPSGLRPYVVLDTDGLGSDLEQGGDIVTVDNPDGGIWIFQAT